jgi:hypothetical protein
VKGFESTVSCFKLPVVLLTLSFLFEFYKLLNNTSIFSLKEDLIISL